MYLAATWHLNFKPGIDLNREHRMQEDSTYEHVKNDQIEKKLIIFEISFQIDLEPFLGSKSRYECKFKPRNYQK